jgi:3-hydroxyisobutyrate dehydrogenase-like beta-hydroxyacid dehydrogenase
MSTISIIGSGGMATAISGRIAKAGHAVEVLSRDPAKARALADKHPPATPRDLLNVVDFLVPELQRRGRFRTEYVGRTLAENLRA